MQFNRMLSPRSGERKISVARKCVGIGSDDTARGRRRGYGEATGRSRLIIRGPLDPPVCLEAKLNFCTLCMMLN